MSKFWPWGKHKAVATLDLPHVDVDAADKRLNEVRKLVQDADTLHTKVVKEKQKNHFAQDTRGALEIGPPRWT